MNPSRAIFYTALATGALMALCPVDARAQYRDVSLTLDGDVGVALPMRELSDFGDRGLHAELGLTYWLNQRVGLRAFGATDQLQGDGVGIDPETSLPDLNLWYVGGEVEVDLLPLREDRRTDLDLTLGGGATTVDTDDFQTSPTLPAADLTHTYPFVGVGIEIGYEVTETLHVELGTRTMLTFADEVDLEPLSSRNVATDPTDQLLTQPVTLGVRLDLPGFGR